MTCLSCANKLLTIYNFGKIPLVNSFNIDKKISNKKFTLNLKVCEKCKILQLANFPKKEKIFKNYKHTSSGSSDNLNHLNSFAKMIKKKIKKTSKILEIVSNDGSLLNLLFKMGFDCTGVEPASNLKKNYNKNIHLINDFFQEKIEKKLKYSQYDLIIGLNVFAHYADVQNSFKLIHKILKKNGHFIFEVAYAFDTIYNSKYDTIYHEHIFNHTATGLNKMLELANLNIVKIQKIQTQGGSLRIFAKKKYKKLNRDIKLLNIEKKNKVNNIETYKKIRKLITIKINEINYIYNNYVDKNKNLLFVGAPARGVIFFNTTLFRFHKKSLCIDDSQTKSNCYFPGSNFKIKLANKNTNILKRYSQAVFLSWNYKKTLLERLKKQNFKGKIFIFFPKTQIVNLN